MDKQHLEWRSVGVPQALQKALIYVENWLDKTHQASLFECLQKSIDWRQDEIQIMGRQVLIPRLQAWYGEPGISYTYSGLRMTAKPWTAELKWIRDKLALDTGIEFNAVLLNRYRNGQDSMGWHADNEPELGPDPSIASISLGGTRRFLMKPKKNNAGSIIRLQLAGGSLLVMHSPIQKEWVHSLPKTKKPVSERLNLTFRRVFPCPKTTLSLKHTLSKNLANLSC